MRHAIAAKSIADLDTASAKMTEMGLGAEPLAKEGLELKDFLVKQVRPLPCLSPHAMPRPTRAVSNACPVFLVCPCVYR